MYENHLGVEKDNAEAARWYKLAAAQGHADAHVKLGAIYESGDGVLQIASEKDWNDKVIKAPGLFLVECASARARARAARSRTRTAVCA